MPESSGFSAVELLSALSITGVLLASGLPAYTTFIDSQRVRAASADFLHSLMLARNEAIRRGVRVSLANRNASWESGWVVFVDTNSNGRLDRGETVIYELESPSRTVRIRANIPVRNYVSYVPSGQSLLATNAFQAGTVSFCPSVSANTGYQVIVSRGGRPRLQPIRSDAAACKN